MFDHVNPILRAVRYEFTHSLPISGVFPPLFVVILLVTNSAMFERELNSLNHV